MANRIAQAQQIILARFEGTKKESDRLLTEQEQTRIQSEQRLADQQEPKPVLSSPELIAERRSRLFLLVDSVPVLYKDVVTESWYAPYVAAVISEGIAQGYKDEQGNLKGEFGVANPVTKAEMLKMALEASGQKLQGGTARNPSVKGSWAEAYVAHAELLQLTVFSLRTDVHTPATRGEMIQTILEAMEIPIPKTPATFNDVPADHPYSAAIGLAAYYGFVVGDTTPAGNSLNRFRPDDPINRAEVSKIIALAREVLK